MTARRAHAVVLGAAVAVIAAASGAAIAQGTPAHVTPAASTATARVVPARPLPAAHPAPRPTVHVAARPAVPVVRPTPAAPPTAAPAAVPVPAVTPTPPAVPSTYGCGPALAYLRTHAAPGFSFECPGKSPGDDQAITTCFQWKFGTPCVQGYQMLIVITVPCAAAYMNEASNSWMIQGLRKAPLDPFGSCP